MEYDKLTDAQKDYLRKLNDIRAALVSVAFNLQQRANELTRAMLDAPTPREVVWNIDDGDKDEYPLFCHFGRAHDGLRHTVERLAEIESVTQSSLFNLRRDLRELDPHFWHERLEEQPEPARDAAEEIYCERNED